MMVRVEPAPLIVNWSVISKSPPAFASSLGALRVTVIVIDGILMTSGPGVAFACEIAALNEQSPDRVMQMPSTGVRSCSSADVVTVKVDAETDETRANAISAIRTMVG